MSYTTISTARATLETYDAVRKRVAGELLDALRDALGPDRRLPGPLADSIIYGYHSVTARDGEWGRVEVTAHLTTSGTVRGYSARIVNGDPERRPWPAAGPVRVDLSQAPEESPSILYVLPLIVRLEQGAERMEKALDALREADLPAERLGPVLALREPCPWGTRTAATVELDPENGALRVHGRDARRVRRVLESDGIF